MRHVAKGVVGKMIKPIDAREVVINFELTNFFAEERKEFLIKIFPRKRRERQNHANRFCAIGKTKLDIVFENLNVFINDFRGQKCRVALPVNQRLCKKFVIELLAQGVKVCIGLGNRHVKNILNAVANKIFHRARVSVGIRIVESRNVLRLLRVLLKFEADKIHRGERHVLQIFRACRELFKAVVVERVR